MLEKTRREITRHAEARPGGAVTLSEQQLEALAAGGGSTRSDPEWKYLPVRRFSS